VLGRLQDWDDDSARRIRESMAIVVIDVLCIVGVNVEVVLGIASEEVLDTVVNVDHVPVELVMIRFVSVKIEIWGSFD